MPLLLLLPLPDCSVSNLKYWSTHKPVVVKTLHLLNDLSIGFNSVRRLATLDIVQFMLENHTVSLVLLFTVDVCC